MCEGQSCSHFGAFTTILHLDRDGEQGHYGDLHSPSVLLHSVEARDVSEQEHRAVEQREDLLPVPRCVEGIHPTFDTMPEKLQPFPCVPSFLGAYCSGDRPDVAPPSCGPNGRAPYALPFASLLCRATGKRQTLPISPSARAERATYTFVLRRCKVDIPLSPLFRPVSPADYI